MYVGHVVPLFMSDMSPLLDLATAGGRAIIHRG